MTFPTDRLHIEKLDRVVGYLNFSNGAYDPRFLADFRDVFATFVDSRNELAAKSEAMASNYLPDIVGGFHQVLVDRAELLKQSNSAFRDVSQCLEVARLTLTKLPAAYREFHSDLLFHQDDEFLFNSFFLARGFEAVLRAGDGREELILQRAIDQLNDYIGHRPIPALESRKIEPYPKEFVRPVPVYTKDAGVAEGKYQAIVIGALKILETTDPNIMRAAHFDLRNLHELSIEPRAFEFDHPINRRPNHHFGQWDERSVGQDGLYHRFVVHQVTLDSLLRRIDRELVAAYGVDWENDSAAQQLSREYTSEASCALAGTILMAAGICGRGPNAHDSNVTLGTLLPIIAGYRDEFYQQLIHRLPEPHRSRLIDEAKRKHQPFGSVRQDLNAELSNCRAAQLVSCRMATIYARMGYHEAAESQANIVPMASVRITCKIDCLLSAANLTVDAFRDSRLPEEMRTSPYSGGECDLQNALDKVPDIFSLLKRGIECGAIVDPWNILGFDSNYSLFPAIENTVVDNRVFELVDIVERILYLCSRLWSEAAGSDQVELADQVCKIFQEIVDWWRQFAAYEVSSVDAVDPQDIFYAAELVAKALNLWHKGGAATGDIAFWSDHAGLFDSPKAYALVIDALMQRRDYKTSMALLIHWLSESELVELQQGDSSFHDLAFRWIAEQRQRLTEADASERQTIWVLIRKFYDCLEANAEEYWIVPEFELGDSKSIPVDDLESHPENDPFEIEGLEDESDEEDDSSNSLYKAAYEGMTYLDSTDDGNESEVFDNEDSFESSELESEVERVTDRLEFIGTLASSWSLAASVPLPKPSAGLDSYEEIQAQLKERQAIFEGWILQATRNREKLIELLASIHTYQLPKSGTDPDSLHEYDRCRQLRDLLLDRSIRTSVEMENAIRLLKAVIWAVDEMLDRKESADSESKEIFETASTDLTGIESDTDAEPKKKKSLVHEPPDPDSIVQIFAAITLRDRNLVEQSFPALVNYMRSQPILYVPLGKGGNPAQIVKARINQSIMRELLASLPAIGLIYETYELTSAALYMERTNSIAGGAVTEFDDLFEVAFKSIVKCLADSTRHLKQELEAAPRNQPPQDVKMECENILFDCVEKTTESFLIPWLEHNDTLRLSILERVMAKESWEKLEGFIKTYGDGLFTQQFLQISNLRAILHQGVERWLQRMQQDPRDQDLRLFDELGKEISLGDAANYLSIILEAVVENYGDYHDYNSNTTQSDQGNMLYILLDFLRLRTKYDRVSWKLKPVVWAHEVIVREQVNGVAKMWRRNLRERVASEADKYLATLKKLRVKYSVQMVSIGRRLEERFGHPMQIDRLRALIAPAMEDPTAKRSRRTFERLQQEVNTFAKSMSGVGMELPSWLAAIEHEVEQYFMPERLKDKSLLDLWVEPVVLPIDDLHEQLKRLPVKQILYNKESSRLE